MRLEKSPGYGFQKNSGLARHDILFGFGFYV